MMELHLLQTIELADLDRVANGYVSDRKYTVTISESENGAVIRLDLTPLHKLFVKKYSFDTAMLKNYRSIFNDEFSFGAYAGKSLIGVIIGEARAWNNSLWIHEFHVSESHRRSGVGRKLMETVSAKAAAAGLRIIVCETQNTNVAAIEAYRKLGFRVEGIDISHYSNDDWPDGEIAIFMKRRLK
jgi:ribosomal protein S18 acetylase RimI-like enzyme